MSIDIDKIVNYRREYAGAIQKNQISGNRLTGLCPFHDDKNASFSVDLVTGKYTCFACGASGNYIDFYAETHGINTKEAYKRILSEYGITPEEKKPAASDVPYNVSMYAEEKHLPKDWLTSTFSLASGRERSGQNYIRIPYLDESCTQVCFRKRYPKTAPQRFKWSQGSAGKIVLYGLWHMAEFREKGYVILVEGESDTQTLWHLGFPALGVPGASMFKVEWCEQLSGLKLYLHIEPDQGGKTFLAQMTKRLREGGFTGEVYTWACSGGGAKDPSDLYIDKGSAAAQSYIKDALHAAKRLDISDIEVAIKDAPVHLRQPEGWIYSEKGISMIDQKTLEPVCICRTPIILTRRLRSVETSEEKIEVAFKRDGKWKSITRRRSELFQSRSIVSLADEGCTVTSENAKFVVRFLQALEEENIDIIDVVESTSSFGWQSGGRFLPGHDGGLVLDIDPSMSGWASSYCMNGTLNGWIKQMRPLRENNRFRFILAGSFTAPLMRILKQRIFFIYNWGGSKGGKTAAIKAALSAWGDPEGLMTSFNSTQVGLERAAAFYSDLPLGIDERQLAGKGQDSLEKLVYMLSSGQGKLRGAKTGGIQAQNTWRTVILASGEEPILRETSQTGVGTRMIEIIGAPFDQEAQAKEMHHRCAENCGWAGPKFVEYIMSLAPGYIEDMYSTIIDALADATGSGNGAHLSAIAAVTTADILLGEAIFEPDQYSTDLIDRAFEMAMQVAREIQESEPPDVNVSAVRFIADWIQMNSDGFKGTARERLGFMDMDNHICIFPTALRKALEGEGFSSRKTIKYLADEKYIITTERSDRDCGVHTSVGRRFEGRTCRVICFVTEKLFDEGFSKDFFEAVHDAPEF